MFRGNNKITVNEATMIDICQAWIEKHISGKAPAVVSVSYDASTNNFKIGLNDPQQLPAEK